MRLQMRRQRRQQMRQAFIRTSNLLQSINASHQERQNEVEDAAAEKKEEMQLKRRKRGSQEHRTRG